MTATQTATTGYIGHCTTCDRPVRGERRDILCPDCGHRVTGKRIIGTITEAVCDDRCIAATRPNCTCTCGGANHGTGWTVVIELVEGSARAQIQARQEAQRAARETKRARMIAEFETWVTDTDSADLVAFLREGDHDGFGFLMDMREMVDAYKPLTDRQAAAVTRCMTAARERAERDAQPAAPVPTGTGVTVEGVVVSVRLQDGYQGHCVMKMLVVSDTGWKVWSTVPGALPSQLPHKVELRGQRVMFTADVTASNDPSFGFASRPRKAHLV